ncbi:hypothetical protein Z517_10061 [Fonsecaea pedrosoi CBS 271.37]|uniref:Xylanolytic transcriptional activator regulatory domain-containing protein n=1 Tax=Fonsecaea pedrosoi CBS 271.37 TaxID=1442368 RepID=A0A0D2GGB0_9EURO|nr:uncharacterized protein Z517_10061 [Fonsecaea pedrosoi CBS 271.37]KIW77615.1 hypothetical protein Z517_10061 [Fonsecaea pedrosoi CBS 271.37]
MYSYYPFLSADAVHQLLLQDLQYLEKLGCYQVPARASVDEFVKAYFRYIHPQLPILDEGEFWRAYTETSSAPTRTISIFVFQAMLFAACSFFPFSILERLGFPNFRTARAAFYRRAKALFHVDSYRSNLCSAQGALLITYYVSASDPQANTQWLSSAISLARTINAHRQNLLGEASVQRRSVLQRLWCCCLVRDRILALALRRPLQIGAEKEILAGDGARILRAETAQSIVYDFPTKLALATSFCALCKLAILSSQVLCILSLDPSSPGSEEPTTITERVQDCAEDLDHWFAENLARYRVNSLADKFLNLQNNVISIYYHWTKIALWNHASYVAITKGCPLHVEASAGWREVKTAIHGIDTSLQRITDQDMLSFMPISIIAHIAIPVLRHILNIKLRQWEQSATARRRLEVYLAALNALKEKYEGVDQVLDYIRRIVTCLDARKMPPPSSRDVILAEKCPPSNNSDGVESLVGSPQVFLRAIVVIQIALSQGKYPEEHELPALPVSSPAGSSTQSMCSCQSNESCELPELGDTFDGLLDTTFITGALELIQTEDAYVDDAMVTGQPNSFMGEVDFDEFIDLHDST